MSKQVMIDENDIIHVGKQKYIGQELDLDDVIADFKRYNKKTLIYPNGYTKEIFCNTWNFKVNIPKKIKKAPLDPYLEYLIGKSHVPSPAKSNGEIERENRKRVIKKIEDIALLNTDMRNFVTLTFDLNKVDSTDNELVGDKFEQFLKNAVQRKGLKYVFVSEYHKKDNKIHFHGLTNSVLEMRDSGTRKVQGFSKPVKLEKIRKWLIKGKITESQVGQIVYNLPEWKYGFSTSLEMEKTQKNVVLYITKYIEKDAMGKNKIFGKRYWSSRNIDIHPIIQLENVPQDVYDNLLEKEYKNPYNSFRYKYVNNIVNKKI